MTDNGKDFSGTVFAGCKIISKLGQGGMGTVYKAHQEALDKFVCVKLLDPELARDQRNIEFFLREARSAAKLDHPNIVHVYNFGQENGSYFIVMSYVEGKSLQDMVTERGPLPVKEATGIMLGVLDGLAHAHSKSVIHRDIKPANILVGADGAPHIVDFGLARSISEEKQLTMAGEMVGTAYFMSPEQGLAAQVDSRADLYAVGATYFYILTGKYPFDGKTSVEVIHKHISDPLPNIILTNPDVPLWASRVIERLMRKKPQDRYQTAAEVASELARGNSGEAGTDSVSAEKTFDLPEVTARISAGTPAADPAPSDAAEPLRPADPEQQVPQIPVVSGQAAAAPEARPVLQLGALHNGLKVAVHLALTTAATGLFILAGASGRVPGSLWSPLATNPAVCFVMAAAGAALFAWAAWQKPLKFTPLYLFYAAAAAAAAYSGGAFIPAPEGADTVTKAFLALKIGLENMFSQANVIVYALVLYLTASRLVNRAGWKLKGLAVAAYLLGLAFTYSYFRAGAELAPERVWLAVGGALALGGLIAALTQKEFSLFFSPQLLFLAANLAMFAMFTNPQVEVLTAQKVRAEALKAARQNQLNMYSYRQAVLEAQSEVLYDEEGRPVERKPPPEPAEVKPPSEMALRNLARVEYYRTLGQRISSALAGSAGIIFIALFLALMANACYVEELLAAYRERELF